MAVQRQERSILIHRGVRDSGRGSLEIYAEFGFGEIRRKGGRTAAKSRQAAYVK